MTEKFSTYVGALPIAPSTTPGSDLLPILQGGVTERAITPLALFGGIPLFGPANVGTVPASGGGTSNFLRADGNWASGPPSTTPITVGSSSVNGGVNGQLLFNNNGTVGGINPSPGINIAARFGSMDVWQRGAGGSASISVPASTTAYTVDGCYLSTGVNQAFSVIATAGIAVGSFKAAFIGRNAGQTGVTQVAFGCPLDSDEIALIAGQFVTLSFTASTGGNWSPSNGTLIYELVCGTGIPKKLVTGYTGLTIPTGQVNQNIPAGSTAARYQTTSQVIVPLNTTQAEITFVWTPTGTAGANDSIIIDDIQLEVVANSTSVATPFAGKDFATQLRLAQRHFWKTFTYNTAPVQNAGITSGELLGIAGVAAGGVDRITGRHPTQMRSQPAAVLFNPAAANAQARDESASLDCNTTSIVTSSEAFLISTLGNAGTVVGNLLGVHATFDSGI